MCVRGEAKGAGPEKQHVVSPLKNQKSIWKVHEKSIKTTDYTVLAFFDVWLRPSNQLSGSPFGSSLHVGIEF